MFPCAVRLDHEKRCSCRTMELLSSVGEAVCSCCFCVKQFKKSHTASSAAFGSSHTNCCNHCVSVCQLQPECELEPRGCARTWMMLLSWVQLVREERSGGHGDAHWHDNSNRKSNLLVTLMFQGSTTSCDKTKILSRDQT